MRMRASMLIRNCSKSVIVASSERKEEMALETDMMMGLNLGLRRNWSVRMLS